MEGKGYVVEHLDIEGDGLDRQRWEALLKVSGLGTDPPYSAVYGIHANDQLVATGARDGNRLKCVAVDPAYRRGPFFGQLLTAMIADAFDLGIGKLFLYTMQEASLSFQRVGFRPLAVTPEGVTLMERGRPALADYLENLRRESGFAAPGEAPEALESLVLDRSLASQAGTLAQNALMRARQVLILVVGGGADLRLVRQHLGNLPGVSCFPADGYLVAIDSFPRYFLPDPAERIRAQAKVDALFFRDQIVPALGITHRTLPAQPGDPVQSAYYQTLAPLLSNRLQLTFAPVNPA